MGRFEKAYLYFIYYIFLFFRDDELFCKQLTINA